LKSCPIQAFHRYASAVHGLLTLSEGNSLITETVFENRLRLAELNAQGQTSRQGKQSSGVPILSGAPVVATDLRASAALVLAALAKGKTTIPDCIT